MEEIGLEGLFETIIKGENFSGEALRVLKKAEISAKKEGQKVGVTHLVLAMLCENTTETNALEKAFQAGEAIIAATESIKNVIESFKIAKNEAYPQKPKH